jgi:hypothetical protein
MKQELFITEAQKNYLTQIHRDLIEGTGRELLSSPGEAIIKLMTANTALLAVNRGAQETTALLAMIAQAVCSAEPKGTIQ